MMKKLISVLLAGALTISLTACSGNAKPASGTTASGDTKAAAAGTTASGSAEKDGNAKENKQAANVNWPGKQVTLYVPAAAGGGTDIFARIVASYLQEKIGATVTVVNQDAGSGMVAYESVRKAAPDGNTLLFWHTGFYVNYYSGMYDYNPNTDFTPIEMFQSGNGQVFVVNGKSEWNDLNDLVEAAKANPGQITYGCQTGGSAQLVAEILMKATDTELRLVDAASQTDKITGVMGGNISLSAITASSARQYVDNGDLKVLSIVDAIPDPLFPETKTAVEQGYEDLYWTQNLCIFGPAGMDEAVAKAINEAVQGLEDDPKAKEQMESAKIAMSPLNYEDSMAQFLDYDELVKNASNGVDWGR